MSTCFFVISHCFFTRSWKSCSSKSKSKITSHGVEKPFCASLQPLALPSTFSAKSREKTHVKMKKRWCSFRPWFSSGLWHFVLINKNWKMYETAIPLGKMLNAFLAIHGRCKFIIFLRGQTPSLSALTLILSLMEHFQGKAKNTVKHSMKSTFSISI